MRYRKQKELFMEKVYEEPNTGCWLWGGYCDQQKPKRCQYGRFKLNNKKTSAHRASFQMFKRPPGKKSVLHKCDVPLCVNPEHLFLGTQKENMHDMRKKGRAARIMGSKNKSSKLDEKTVRQIRAAYLHKKRGYKKELVKKLNVSPSTIHNIVAKKTWVHVL